MPEVFFTLHLPAEKMKAYYRGEVRFVQVIAEDGQTVRFPARYLRRHLRPQGVQGRFRLIFDQQNRLKDLMPCSD